ncbi:DNA-3-methyladenine glycosylase [Prosthecochloris sp. N3]|uniref:Putative 3-methyladenine DNA glycosylase n=1 Tax=Prosthecochloris ethylica TaxID=2743976 RepID=A0ABR9XPB5_9CHLB|nr:MULTISPECIES: DNA-3-methyladenine glycosylase [Prosthecochloris]MEC9487378.1 DNA-3-methyladenine glycosylase [Prosthecochloris sp.]MBF0585710.1 DNA-3-methyladenine glycosylase [Prosthecochloris ethylica]MBF0635620.1 DNA-3-methyladenine glycosylase [Prosthecochloris ethylica]NUK46919.1 DNA-3-methyladenine glycosylase [Prosthecochloris ethylica]RNA65414.1 DNA-3-methyladenine glycosylase [Prosthecochloris sp. ZM_2]
MATLRKIDADFYRQPTLEMAEALLGKVLVHRSSAHTVLKGRIVETEAYLGEGDEACHAFRGMTPRNSTMFGPPATLYVYFTYGNHYLINIVTEQEGTAGAVLIRAMEPLEGIGLMHERRNTASRVNLMNGPGKLTEALGITTAHNGCSLLEDTIYLEDDGEVYPGGIVTTARIGITRSTALPWRKYLRASPYVSKAKPGPPGRKKKQHVLES